MILDWVLSNLDIVVGLVAGAFGLFYVNRSTKQKQENKQLHQRLEDIETKNEVKNEVKERNPSDNRKRLSDWVRR